MLSSPEFATDQATGKATDQATGRIEPLRLEELRSFTRPAHVLPQFQPAGAATPTEPPVFEVADATKVDPAILQEARSAAQAVGYAQGWAEGIRESRAAQAAERKAMAAEYRSVAAERRERTARAIAAMDQAASRLENRALRTAEEMESAIIDSAFDIAEAIVGAVLRDDETRGALAVRRALSLAPASEEVIVALHPADHAVITSNGTVALQQAASGRQINFVADEALEPGDAIASWQATTVDARISSGLQRVREVLGR